jgi:hypothetical protein
MESHAMNISRFFLAAFTLALVACSSTGTNSPNGGKTLSLKEGTVSVSLDAPSGWTVVSSKDEPLDWNYAASAPKGDERELGVRLDEVGPHAATTYQDYLKNVHQLYDPKVLMAPEAPFTLKDGRRITPYRYYSAYWKQRLVIIIPEGKAATVLEFTAPTLASLRGSHVLIQQMLDTYGKK